MNPNQAAEFLHSQMMPRWPDWHPASVEIQDWIGWMEKYDYDVACRAAAEHARTTRYFKRPVNGEFFEICEKLHQEFLKKNPPKRNTKPRLSVSLVCTENSRPEHGIRKGMRFAVIPRLKETDVMQYAEKLLVYYEENFGGKYKLQVGL